MVAEVTDVSETRIFCDDGWTYKQYDISNEVDSIASAISERTVLTYARAHKAVNAFIEELIANYAPGGGQDGD